MNVKECSDGLFASLNLSSV